MKAKEIREFTNEEVAARLAEEQDKLLKLRLNHAVSAIENPSEIRDARREVARLKTIIRERQLAEQQIA